MTLKTDSDDCKSVCNLTITHVHMYLFSLIADHVLNFSYLPFSFKTLSTAVDKLLKCCFNNISYIHTLIKVICTWVYIATRLYH